MDANVALWKMRELSEIVLNADGHASPIEIDMAELWQSLDAWLCQGGNPPIAWQTHSNQVNGTVTGTVVQTGNVGRLEL